MLFFFDNTPCPAYSSGESILSGPLDELSESKGTFARPEDYFFSSSCHIVEVHTDNL